MREIYARYTKSELAYLAWDSKKKAYEMHERMKPSNGSRKDGVSTAQTNVNRIGEDANMYYPPESINGGVSIPKSFFDENGDLDLRRAKGVDALRYMQALGVQIPVIH